MPRRPITLTPDDLELMKEGDAIAAKVAVDFQIPDVRTSSIPPRNLLDYMVSA